MRKGRRRITVLAVFLLGMIGWASASRAIFAQALERSLHVTVLDQAGNDVSGLGPSDFVVHEDKATREVLRVGPGDDPMQVALLVDDSTALGRSLGDVRASLTAFVTAITGDSPTRGKHDMALITLSSRPTIKVSYTSDSKALLKETNSIFPQPASRPTLLDGIAEASDGLAKRHATRPVIVVVATETEDASFRLYDQVLSSLEKSGASLYVLGIGQPFSQQDRSIVLDQGTKTSGGEYQTVLASNALSARLMRLAGHLTHQYLVTYARPNSLIPPDRVTVGAAKPGLTARGTLVKAE
ncbi:MAG TPA: VWA domain-containing protein [Vicinamibacterales bacterium]|nr:VWA domain-containing protein [Vicinamibacterales bacterium]